MLAWVFRHRARLQVIYGRVEGPALAGERFRAPDAGGRIEVAGPSPAAPFRDGFLPNQVRRRPDG